MPSKKPDQDKAATAPPSPDPIPTRSLEAHLASQVTAAGVTAPEGKGKDPEPVAVPEGQARYIPPLAPANALQPDQWLAGEMLAGVQVDDPSLPSFARPIPYNEANASPEQRGERPGSFVGSLEEAYARAAGTWTEPKAAKGQPEQSGDTGASQVSAPGQQGTPTTPAPPAGVTST